MDINLFGAKKIEIRKALEALPEGLENTGGLFRRAAGDTDFLTTKNKVDIKDAAMLEQAFNMALRGHHNSAVHGVIAGKLARIIEPKKHSLLRNGKPRRLGAWAMLFCERDLLMLLAGAVIGFFISEAGLNSAAPKPD